MDLGTNTVRELTNAELDAVGGGISIGGLGDTVGAAVKGIEKLGNEILGDANKFLKSVSKDVGGFLGGLFG